MAAKHLVQEPSYPITTTVSNSACVNPEVRRNPRYEDERLTYFAAKKNRVWRGERTLYGLFLILTVTLLASATGCSYLQRTTPNGKISVQTVSWKLVKKLAEPEAGLSGHKVTILNAADQSVIASGTTDSSGLLEFDVPPGTYTVLGASDGPKNVQVQAGQTANFKLIVH